MSTDVVAVEFTVTQEEVTDIEARLPEGPDAEARRPIDASAPPPGEPVLQDVRFRVLIPPVGAGESVKIFVQETNELDEIVWTRHDSQGIRVGGKLVLWRRTVLALALHRLIRLATGKIAIGRAIVNLDAFE